MRRAAGHETVGVKVGYANKAMWRVLKLDTLVWAHMYDDTVRYADANDGHALGRAHDLAEDRAGDRVQAEGAARRAAITDAAAALEAVEWLALGFEIIDCVYADWKFQPADFVAAYGLHAALVVGEPRPVTAAGISGARRAAADLQGQALEGRAARRGRRGPELAAQSGALPGRARVGHGEQDGAEPLGAGDLVSSGTLTESAPIAPGATWTASVEGIDLPALTLTLV